MALEFVSLHSRGISNVSKGLGRRLHVGFKERENLGLLGGSVDEASNFGSGHDLTTVCEFEPHVELWASVRQFFSGPISYPLSSSRSDPTPLMLALSKMNKHFFFLKKEESEQ